MDEKRMEKVLGMVGEDPMLQEMLDEAVRDKFDSMASKLNNQGARAQLEWLEEQGDSLESVLGNILAEAGDGDEAGPG